MKVIVHDWMTAGEVAELLQLSKSTVRRLGYCGTIYRRPAGKRRYSRESVEAYDSLINRIKATVNGNGTSPIN